MNLKVGIVGLPNAGKSTLFNALLKKQVAEIANYPFTTIEPNVGVVPVPDQRLIKLAEIVEREEGFMPPVVPAVVEFVDIAGLVKGAALGQGLGNKFLSHIREVDLIINVLRIFPDPTVIHVAGEVDPNRDKEIVETELILADLETLNKQVEPRGVKDQETARRWELIESLKIGLDGGRAGRRIIIDADDHALIRDLHLLTMKPVLYVANVAENQLVSPDVVLNEVKDLISSKARDAKNASLDSSATPQNDGLVISAKTEAELASLSPDEQKTYLKDLGLKASGLDRLIKKAYEMLGLISFLTQGVKEVRAWTIEKNTKAPRAAGVIHTDFEKKFIKAEVISFKELLEVGSWKLAKEVGKLRMEGKEYVMADGDVVEFMIGR